MRFSSSASWSRHYSRFCESIRQCFFLSFFFKINLFIYLFLAAFGLRCCAWASLVVVSGGYSLLQCASFSLQWLLLLGTQALSARASVVVAHGFQQLWLTGSRAQAQLLHGLQDLPRPGLEPVSPALAGGFLTTAPPGKSLFLSFQEVLSAALGSAVDECLRLPHSPQILMLKSQPPEVMVLVGGAFGRSLSLKDGTLTNEISALLKRLHRASQPLPPCEDTMRSLGPGKCSHWTMLAPRSQTSSLQNCEK